MSGRKGTAHRYVRNADRDRCEQAAASGWTLDFAAQQLGLPVSVIEQVWADMDAIHGEEPRKKRDSRRRHDVLVATERERVGQRRFYRAVHDAANHRRNAS